MVSQAWSFIILAGLAALGTSVAHAQTYEAGQDCSAIFRRKRGSDYIRSLGSEDPFVGATNGEGLGVAAYPDVAALFDLKHACCPDGSFISEWEATLKTLKALPPFNDGHLRSLNGTLLDDYVDSYSGVYSPKTGRLSYRTWTYGSEGLGSIPRGVKWQPSWDDVQGIALSLLQNVTVLGSLAAKCSLSNGTIVAALPVVGGNLTDDCFNPPELEVTESDPIRILNSTLMDGSFVDLYTNVGFKLPKYGIPQGGIPDSHPKLYGLQENLIQDFMGLVQLLELDAENAPEIVDLASLNASALYVYKSYDYGRTIGDGGLDPSFAVHGFAAIEGCYGPLELQVFEERRTLDVATPPVASSYSSCSHENFDRDGTSTYQRMGNSLEAINADTYYGSDTDRFVKTPLVCCPDGEYITSFDLEFSGDPNFFQRRFAGSVPQELWGITGICSKGTRLPAISGGNGCVGRDELLPASNYTVQVPYGNEKYGDITAITYNSPDAGFHAFAGVGPNASELTGNIVRLGKYGNPKGMRPRIVGLDATASCGSLASVGLVLRSADQVGGSGGLSGGAIAGIVIGVIAAVALLACAIILIRRRRARYRGTRIETLPINAQWRE